MRDKILFYDIEVFKYDALVVFKDIEGNTVAKFWSKSLRDSENPNEDRWLPSGFEGLSDVAIANHDVTLVGYNNYHYDDFILSHMMKLNHNGVGYLKQQNDRIINGNNSTVNVNSELDTLDCMQQISVSHPGLKLIEGNMGKMIKESSISFDIDRPLTEDERKETEFYCEYDVLSTIEVYKLRKESYFDVKQSLISYLPESKQGQAQRWNTTTISAMILTNGKSSQQWDEITSGNPVRERMEQLNLWGKDVMIPDDIWEMWETKEHVTGKSKSKTKQMFGCNVVFGFGGLHGAPSKPGVYEDILLDDVGSMYPSAIVRLNALGDNTSLYDDIRKQRLAIKHTDPIKASALKLVLNSVYGNFKNKYSALNNPFAGATVCVYGQIAIFDLAKRLYEAGFQVININTDGVAFVNNKERQIEHELIREKWQKNFPGFVLETDHFDRWIQRDVNNYIAVEKGKIKVKGGDVNKYHKDRFFDNNNARIIQIALVERLLNGTAIDTTFDKYLDRPEYWQYVLKAGGTYKGVRDDKSNQMMDTKVNRVFAVNDSAPNQCHLVKVRADDASVNFPDTPERMMVWNDDCDSEKLRKVFPAIIDRDHYKAIVRKKEEAWRS